jgi:hypothetical protein
MKLAIGRFIDCHPDWQVCGTADGYTAQRRGPRGRPVGAVLTGTSLDELGARIQADDRCSGTQQGEGSGARWDAHPSRS